MSEKIPVYDNDYCGNVVGRVTPNTKLDYWDGSNYTDGSTGNHLGYTKLRKSQKYVLIHTTQWEGCKDYGYVVSPEHLIEVAIENDCLEGVLSDYPELKALVEKINDTD